MKLYHGTTAIKADRIKHEGLKPRSLLGGKSNYAQFPSREDCVYLSSCYGPWFAVSHGKGKERLAVIEVDTDLLPGVMLPDEDFLEQMSRPIYLVKKERPKHTALRKRRTEHYRNNLEQYASCWENSINTLGTCAHLGSIQPEGIARIAYFSFECWVTGWFLGTQVHIWAHDRQERLWKLLTRWLFDGDVDLDRFPIHLLKLRYHLTDLQIMGRFNREGIEIEKSSCLSFCSETV